MHTRDFHWKLKSLEDAGTFEGLASPYGYPADYQDDVIEPGAYAQAIAQQGDGYPLLWRHDEPIGLARIGDSQKGLGVRGQVLMEDPVAKRAHLHMKAGSVKGLSIGFTIPKGEGKVSYRDGVRHLKEIHLHEISVVAIPAAPRAQITAVKSGGGSLSIEVANLLHLLKNCSAINPDARTEFLEIDRELRRLLAGHNPAEEKAAMLRELQTFASELKRVAA